MSQEELDIFKLAKEYENPESFKENPFEDLPVFKAREKIEEAIKNNPTVLIEGNTGSGKSVFIPQIVKNLFGDGKILMGMPRRLACISVSDYISETTKSDKFGYRVGAKKEIGEKDFLDEELKEFENVGGEKIGINTKVEFSTYGAIKKILLEDPLLRGYDSIIIDEAHEESLDIEITMYYAKKVQELRRKLGRENCRKIGVSAEFKVIITSATINRDKICNYFNIPSDAAIKVEGRMFPVREFSYDDVESFLEQKNKKGIEENYYDQPIYEANDEDYDSDEDDYSNDYNSNDSLEYRAVQAALASLETQKSGDILIFMPGKKEIEDTIERLETNSEFNNFVKLPLHSEIEPSIQAQIFQPSQKRKIIVSTNIAETSLTIPGVTVVIDSANIKQVEHDVNSGVTNLQLVNHSKSGLKQRMGRAGRVQEGDYYLLTTKEEEQQINRPDFSTPEIFRNDLSTEVLMLLSQGVNLKEAKLMNQPDPEKIEESFKLLEKVGAIDGKQNITEIGEFIKNLPLDVKLGRAVYESKKLKVTSLASLILAISSGKNIFSGRDKPNFNIRISDDIDLYLISMIGFGLSGYSQKWAENNNLNFKSLSEVYSNYKDILKSAGKFSDEVDFESIIKNNLPEVLKQLQESLKDIKKESYETNEEYNQDVFNKKDYIIKTILESIYNELKSKNAT